MTCEDHLRLLAAINPSRQLHRSQRSQSNKCTENHQIGLRRSKLQIHLEPRLANTKPTLDMPTVRARCPAVSSMAAMQTSCAGTFQLSRSTSILCSLIASKGFKRLSTLTHSSLCRLSVRCYSLKELSREFNLSFQRSSFLSEWALLAKTRKYGAMRSKQPSYWHVPRKKALCLTYIL